MFDYSADLHLHTIFSDGTYTPQQLVRKAKNLRFSAISITDHDIIDAIPIAKEEADILDIELIPGIELTMNWGQSELHLLGYCIDWDKKWFKELLNNICRVRSKRIKKMIFKLNKLGIDLKIGDVFNIEDDKKKAMGRLQLANVLFKKGIVSSPQEAFDKYIGNSSSCYVEKYKLSPEKAISIILDLNGVPVIAHPGVNINEEIISKLVDIGLKGIEVYHPSHNKKQIKQYKQIAQYYNLIITGGSDCHGEAKNKVLMGKIRVSKDIVDSLKNKKKEISHV